MFVSQKGAITGNDWQTQDGHSIRSGTLSFECDVFSSMPILGGRVILECDEGEVSFFLDKCSATGKEAQVIVTGPAWFTLDSGAIPGYVTFTFIPTHMNQLTNQHGEKVGFLVTGPTNKRVDFLFDFYRYFRDKGGR